MPPHNFFRNWREAPWYLKDPGDGGALDPSKVGVYHFKVGTTAETNTLAAPTRDGLMVGMFVESLTSGTRAVTVASAYDEAGSTVLTFAGAGQYCLLMSFKLGSVYVWRIVGFDGVTGPTIEFGGIDVDTLTVDTTLSTPIVTRGDAVTAEHGAGAVGTGVAPATYRYTRDGVIITDIEIDLDGLKCKGDAAKDAIGLTGAAYIGRYVTATCGIVFRVELICLEAPGEGTATITADIDLGADDEATIAYDGAVDDVVINTGGIAAGCTYVDDVPALTANDYLYLVEGDTTAATGIYNAGQIIVRLYGHALLA